MENKIEHNTSAERLRYANTRMIARYSHWMSHMLTVTFRAGAAGVMPCEEQVRAQLRHMTRKLNSKVWHNKTRFNAKCQILCIPVIEGANTTTRIHAHMLLGNLKDAQLVHECMRCYIPNSNWLAPGYDLRSVYDADGAARYLTKETGSANLDAVAWEIASIPKPLMP